MNKKYLLADEGQEKSLNNKNTHSCGHAKHGAWIEFTSVPKFSI